MKNHTITIQEMTDFLRGTVNTGITNRDTKKATYQWIEDALVQIRYRKLKKKDQGVVLKYLGRYTRYSHSHVKRLAAGYLKRGHLAVQERTQHTFPVIYTTQDIELLATLSEACSHPNGKVLVTLCKELYEHYGDARFVRLKNLSVSHCYNLQKRQVFLNATRTFTKTKKTMVPIGKREKPRPEGKPGYIRVDSVHQGDRNGEKSVYHITLVDEVTQWITSVCVPVISERYVVPALQKGLSQFPFEITNMHTDNGSEYINYGVQEILAHLHITHTKGRPRRCNDNALVESKNASIVRNHMGYHFIPKECAAKVTDFYDTVFNEYLNYHRPCHVPEEVTLPNGKRKRIYPTCMTPVAKLISLPEVHQYLKNGVTASSLSKNTCNRLITSVQHKLCRRQKVHYSVPFHHRYVILVSVSFMDWNILRIFWFENIAVALLSLS